MRTGPPPRCPCGDRQAGGCWDLGPHPPGPPVQAQAHAGWATPVRPRAFPGFTRFRQAEGSCRGAGAEPRRAAGSWRVTGGPPPTQATNWGPPIGFIIYVSRPSSGGSEAGPQPGLRCPWPGSPGQGLRPWRTLTVCGRPRAEAARVVAGRADGRPGRPSLCVVGPPRAADAGQGRAGQLLFWGVAACPSSPLSFPSLGSQLPCPLQVLRRGEDNGGHPSTPCLQPSSPGPPTDVGLHGQEGVGHASVLAWAPGGLLGWRLLRTAGLGAGPLLPSPLPLRAGGSAPGALQRATGRSDRPGREACELGPCECAALVARSVSLAGWPPVWSVVPGMCWYRPSICQSHRPAVPGQPAPSPLVSPVASRESCSPWSPPSPLVTGWPPSWGRCCPRGASVTRCGGRQAAGLGPSKHSGVGMGPS